MAMAVRKITPRVNDGDHGFSLKILERVSHLLGARTMRKGPQIVRTKPAMTAQLLRSSFRWHRQIPIDI
jgi:hypothetical protein